ncbi:MAG TPA: SsrA-binding protein SmpB [Clostridiaceae bacterium]|mgnify:FL=1|nr:SsrA-binding protein SmpB [Clostridiaceae bacterium]
MSKVVIKNIAVNRKAGHDYHLLEKYEAGIELFGMEVKSIRQNKVSLADTYAQIIDGEAWIIGMHISPYKQAGQFRVDPDRKRKLLLQKREIRKIQTDIQQKGLTLVPTKLYLKGSLVKIEIAVARGKKSYDKRQDLKTRELEQQIRKRVEI